MKFKLFELLFLFVTLGISVYAQPGIAVQNSLSFANGGNNVHDVLSNYGLITIYPTGGSNFDVPNVGEVSYQYEPSDVRVVDSSVGEYIGYITYLTPSQINLWCVAELLGTHQTITLGGNVSIKVQRKVSNVWTDKSTTQSIYFEDVVPHTSIVYESGNPHINADLYVWNGSSYVYYKKTLDGNSNPKVYNSQPTVLVFYVTGASPNAPDFYICDTDVLLNGSNRDDLLIYGFTASGFNGVQQVAMYVPSTITSSTTIQFGAKSKYLTCDGRITHYGNSSIIPNWN